MTKEILSGIKAPTVPCFDLADLSKGIDNYHLDIKLSDKFKSDTKKLVSELCKNEASRNSEIEHNELSYSALSLSYQDMMTVLIHRVKTELTLLEVNVLQFAAIKYVLVTAKFGLDKYLDDQRAYIDDLRKSGSSTVLKQQDYFIWLKKNQQTIQYKINNKIIAHLYKAEQNNLLTIRNQYLEDSTFNFVEILFNPMLKTTALSGELFCVENYLLWQKSMQNNEFSTFNDEVEHLMEKYFPELEVIPLYRESPEKSAEKEIYDELGGLMASSTLLGPALDLKDKVSENLCCLDSTVSVEQLFNIERLQNDLITIRKENGLKQWWACRRQVNRSKDILKQLRKALSKNRRLAFLIASCTVKKIWSKEMAAFTTPVKLCLFLSGETSEKIFFEKCAKEKSLTEEQIKLLKNSALEVKEGYESKSPEALLKILLELARYRLHLKYYRFAHRIFNRINILEKEDELKLSKVAGTLYQLPIASEVENESAKILHHTILKADIRGSTTITQELEKKGLNPASYFSLRFFSPINDVLPVYGANKVFIEGDASILSFLEHEHNPEQWFTVARACGVASAILGIIHANNHHSKQMGLPPMELGIGICYSAEAPRFLYDEEQAIMISSAIGLADRLSSCSWKLRKAMKPGGFNVEVLKIDEVENDIGEKGQKYIRYNVNGILLENEAFEKLCSEIKLQKISAEIEGQSYMFYRGDYPDAEGNNKNILIREGIVGLWKNGSVNLNVSDSENFYEVVSNPKLISVLTNNND